MQVAQISPKTDLATLPEECPWLLEKRLVVKPDQLIKRRGKANLLKLNATWDEVVEWVNERRDKEVQVEVVQGKLDHFIVEPFLPHEQSDEYYICIQSHRDFDEILFYHEGGINVGDVDAKAVRLQIKVGHLPTEDEIQTGILTKVPEHRRATLADYIEGLYQFYSKYHFVYLEINPLVMTDAPANVTALDLAAKIDEAARHECSKIWSSSGGALEFPPAFGRKSSPEEDYIASLDEKTGASLKLTILNPHGRFWTMVAGGGASVIYADTLADCGAAGELANYGEYSGAPTESLTYEYARTILKLMTREKHPDGGKLLFIGGGIANFTNVAETFNGIIRAITEVASVLKDHDVSSIVCFRDCLNL